MQMAAEINTTTKQQAIKSRNLLTEEETICRRSDSSSFGTMGKMCVSASECRIHPVREAERQETARRKTM